MARSILLAAAALAALLLAVWMVTPSRPLPADAPPMRFSAGRAMADVAALGREPHPTGSPANRRNLAYLAHRLAGLRLDVALQPVALDDKARRKLARQTRGAVSGTVTGANLVGLIRGRDREQPAVLLMAHHDTVGGSPGAADDTIGVAALLEVARALQAGPRPARDVILLITDGEEMGLSGARTFFASPLKDHVGLVVNVDMRGGGGRALMFETARGNGALIRRFADAVPWPSASSLSVMIYRGLPNRTDLTPALEQGLFGINFSLIGRAELYHSPLATPERIDPASLQDLGQQVLAITRATALAPRLPARTPDLVFADLWGSRLIAYPAWGGWVVLATTALLMALAAYRAGPQRLRPVMVARALAVPALVLLTAVPIFIVNRLSGAGAGAEYYDRLAALPRLEAQTVAIAVAALLLIARVARAGRWAGWFALMTLTLLIGLAVQLIAPMAGPLIHWPMLGAALAMAIAASLDPTLERPSALAPVAAIAALGVGQSLGYGHLLFLSVGAGLPEVTVPTILLPVALLLWPLLHRTPSRRTTLAATGAAVLIALSLATWVRVDPVAPSVPVYASDKS